MASARSEASREIAEALRVSVHSTGEVVAERGASGRMFSSHFRVDLESRVSLSHLTMVKRTRASGRYYVALGYDNRTLFQKVAADREHLLKRPLAFGEGYKAALPLARELATAGVFPSQFHLVRRHGGWTLRVDPAVYPVDTDAWFRLCFVEKTENKGLRIGVTPEGLLASGSPYQVHLSPPEPTGSLSLYHVSESGQVLSLMTNRPVDSLSPLTFPDENFYEGLEAIPDSAHGSRDMLLVRWDPEPIHSGTPHAPISVTPLSENDGRTFSYGDLLEQLRDTRWASCFVWIQAL